MPTLLMGVILLYMCPVNHHAQSANGTLYRQIQDCDVESVDNGLNRLLYILEKLCLKITYWYCLVWTKPQIETGRHKGRMVNT